MILSTHFVKFSDDSGPRGVCQLQDPPSWYFVPFILQFVSSIVFVSLLHKSASASSKSKPSILLVSSNILNLSFFLAIYFDSKDSLKRVEIMGLSLVFNFFVASKLMDEHLFIPSSSSNTRERFRGSSPRVEIVRTLSESFGGNNLLAKGQSWKEDEGANQDEKLCEDTPAYALSNADTPNSDIRSGQPRFTLSRIFSRRRTPVNAEPPLAISEPLPPPAHLRNASIATFPTP